jgi:hypothetical protein
VANYKNRGISFNQPIRESLILSLILLAARPPDNCQYRPLSALPPHKTISFTLFLRI